MQNEIYNKLNEFITKYYKNLVVRGLIYTLLLLIIFFVVLSIIEYFGWMSTLFRTIVFYAYILLTLIVIGVWVVRPLFKLFRIGKTLSYNEAAKIIGKHFSSVQDKLLNLLQLQQISQSSENELLTAAIEQKTQLLRVVPFQKAINTTKTKKFSRYLIGVVVVVGIVLCFFPQLFSEPSKRYLDHNTFYEKPAPFSFEVQSPLTAIQRSDYQVKVKVKGEILPEKVNVIVDGQTFEMKQDSKTEFSYLISQIQKTTSLQFEAVDVYSKIYEVVVNPKPILTDLTAEVIYPAYTKIKNETLSNVTDLSLPQGTKIVWHIQTKDCNKVILNSRKENLVSEDSKINTEKNKIESVKNPTKSVKNKIKSEKNLTKSNIKTTELIPNKRGNIDFAQTYYNSQIVTLKTKNNYTISMDSIEFSINTIRDERPSIAVIEQKDSIVVDNIYFRGQIKDDYGFSKLLFAIKITPQNSTKAKIITKALPITDNENNQEFYYAANLTEYKIEKGDKVDYWFEVWDNDAINGAKSTKSQTFTVDIPTEKQLDERLSKNSEQVSQQTNQTLDEIRKLQKEIKDLTQKLTEKKELNWQDEKTLQQIKQKQEEIQQKVQEIQQKIEENSLLEEKYKEIDPEIAEKQRQLEELFKELQNKDLEDLMKQMNDLLDKKLDKSTINEQLQNISKKNEDISKQLDKNLEFYKRLNVEKDIEDIIDKLKDLSQKQKQLSEQTKNKQDSKENLQQKQEELNKEFKDLQKKIEQTKKKDAQLESPFNFKQDKPKEQQIEQKQKQAQENIKNNKNKKASENQKQAAEQMDQMQQQMQDQLDENEEEQLAEDIDDVRQILKNLVTLSKKQEDLIYTTQKTLVSDPAYQKIINSQNTIKESMQTIADSLYQISKHQPQVTKVINDETSKVASSIDKSLSTLLKFNQSYYTNYKNNQAAINQQYSMSSMNNLALLLAESLDNMNKQQQQMLSKKHKSNRNARNQCNNPSPSPKGNKPKNMRQLQEALNQEIERLQNELQKRGNQSKQKIGENKELNEKLAKAAAQQEMIRKMMQEYVNELKKENAKSFGTMNQTLQQMEQTEKDIVNKRINTQTLNRQKQILTRMLESEKAQMKKDKEEKRESKTGIDKIEKQNNQSFEEFKKLKNRDMELLQKIPPVYSSYYKTKISEYFSNFENSNK